MADGHSDALMELVRTLREQLTRKDERIESLERLLVEQSRQLADCQRLIVRLMESRSASSSPVPARAAVSSSPTPSEAVPAPVAPPSPPPATPEHAAVPAPAETLSPTARLPRRSPPKERPPISLPDRIGPPMEEIAQRVISAAEHAKESIAAPDAGARAPSAPEKQEYEVTARFERDKIRSAHKAMETGKRGFWFWRSRAR